MRKGEIRKRKRRGTYSCLLGTVDYFLVGLFSTRIYVNEKRKNHQ